MIKSTALKNRLGKVTKITLKFMDSEDGKIDLSRKEKEKMKKQERKLWIEMGRIADKVGIDVCENTDGYFDLCCEYEDLVDCQYLGVI